MTKIQTLYIVIDLLGFSLLILVFKYISLKDKLKTWQFNFKILKLACQKLKEIKENEIKELKDEKHWVQIEKNNYKYAKEKYKKQFHTLNRIIKKHKRACNFIIKEYKQAWEKEILQFNKKK